MYVPHEPTQHEPKTEVVASGGGLHNMSRPVNDVLFVAKRAYFGDNVFIAVDWVLMRVKG